jgi:hypothetical protein
VHNYNGEKQTKTTESQWLAAFFIPEKSKEKWQNTKRMKPHATESHRAKTGHF